MEQSDTQADPVISDAREKLEAAKLAEQTAREALKAAEDEAIRVHEESAEQIRILGCIQTAEQSRKVRHALLDDLMVEIQKNSVAFGMVEVRQERNTDPGPSIVGEGT